MKFIENIIHTVKRELFYQWHSKKIIMLFAIILILCGIHLIGLHNQVLENYDMYIRMEQMLKSEGVDIVETLGEELNVYIDGDSKIVSNPLKQDFINLSISIRHLEPQNIISNTLEYIIFAFCTLIFGIYACYIATYDFKHKTYKFISICNNQREIIIGKIISVIIVMFMTLALALTITFIGSFIVRLFVERSVPTNNFVIDTFNYEYGLIPQLLLTFAILLFYIIIGFSVAFILKSMVIPTIGLLAYGLLIPMLGTYDFRNIFSYFAHNIFSFNARFIMVPPLPINEILGIFILIFAQFLLLLLLFVVSDQRSAYN